MRILVVYPGATHSTYDVARGYHKALAATAHTVAAFEYHNYIKFYQNALDYQSHIVTEYTYQDQDAVMLAASRVVVDVVDFVPDVVLIIAGGALHKRAYDLIDRLRIPMVLLLTESPYIDETQAAMIKGGHVKAALTNDLWSVARLHDATEIPVHYLPHSYDPELHYPHPLNSDYQTSAFFHGTLWPERLELLAGLPDVHVTGHTIDGEAYNSEGSGLMVNSELAEWYSNTDIAINHHRSFSEFDECPPAYSLGPRAFEIAACGAFQLCDTGRQELADVFGDSVATYSDRVTLEAQLEYYRVHTTEREGMAQAARGMVKDCTFTARMNNILLPVLEEVCNG